ncbi:hypothetical protein HJC23_013071 [Cyclotella cryptica]|uniref:Protein ENHANCED DISEASE RESISTANCE 2 C-terminal domain-containing protein n=1 Tax=Cyclotella cryptica TaxID=29204 RepID=A0ABD3Q656_9STRA
MSTNSNNSDGGEKKHRHRAGTATAQIKRVIQAGEVVTGRIVRDSPAVVFSKHGGQQRQVEARGDSSADLHDDGNECLEAVEIPAQLSASSSQLGVTVDKPSLQCNDMFASMLCFCALLCNAMYTSYCHKLSILANNQFPLYVVLPWFCLSFVVGRYFDSAVARFSSAQRPSGPEALSTLSSDKVNTDKPADITTLQQQQQQGQQKQQHVSVAKQLLRKVTIGKVFGKEVNVVHTISTRNDQSRQKKNGFWSILSIDTTIQDAKQLERAIRPDLNVSNVLMKYLLTHPDFRKRGVSSEESSPNLVSGVHAASTTATQAGQSTSNSTIRTYEDKDTAIGNAILNNVHDASFEDDANFSYIVEPLCSFRGMDLFLSDCPEGEIWRQPLLNECGLRDTPTLVGNIMLPFGNMTVYLKLPSWFDDWNNIPEETDNDEPEVLALKRFLSGDNEYRNKHAKIVPFVVDGPMAIRLIKPKPQAFTLTGIRHPVTWHDVPKSIDPKTGRVSSALLEFDVDLVSNKGIRKVTSMVRPHLSKITMDIALILSKPHESEADEPSACISMWRIDKVDFESCAVFPQKSVDEVVEEMKSFIALEEMGCDRTKVQVPLAK